MAKKRTSMDQKKGRKPAAASAEAGHNSGETNGGLTDGEKQALFLSGMNTLRRLIVEKDRVTSEVRNQRKRMKADGFEPFEIDYALKLGGRKEEEMVAQRKREARIARWLGHPIGTQADFFGEDHPESSARAGNGAARVSPEELGRVAGAGGEVCKPPSNLNQDDAQRWITGWGKGQKALLKSGIKPPANQPDL